MAPTLYHFAISPPVRAVLMTAKAIGLQLNLKEVDLYKLEHTNPEFVKVNPQHTVPTFVDEDGFIIWDSHAINAYIVSKYAKNDALYPKDLKKRAVIDQRLHFDSGVAYIKLLNVVMPIYGGKTSIDQKVKDDTKESYGLLEAFLKNSKWVAGDSVTIADHCLIATISSLDGFVPVESERFLNVVAWMKRCQTLPEYQENVPGLTSYIKYMTSKLKTV